MQFRFDDVRTGQLGRQICESVADRGGVARYVGGSVRDAMLRHPVADLDIEVSGIEPAELEGLLDAMTRRGVSLVGASFGVFKLHGAPIDVSVPRRERKSGQGHRGFEIEADPNLDRVQAAARRDFTINAMAWDPLLDELVDPFGGRQDLEAGILRHTSDQFDEDPLRVLRGMQFIARFGLTPDSETVRICRAIEPEGLAAERIFEEWRKLILLGNSIKAGLDFLRATEWVGHTPELEALIGCEQDPEWHPEGDVWVHTGHVMDEFARRRAEVDDPWENLVVGFGALCHDLGKPSTTVLEDGRWRSPGHEEAGEQPTRSFLRRMTNQSDLADAVVPLVREHLKPDQLFKASASPRAVRRLAGRVGRIDRLLRVAEADRRGRPGREWDGFPAGDWLLDQAAALDVLDQAPRPIVLGRHLIEMGLEPGPHFSRLLAACFEAQLDGQIATVDEGKALVESLV